MILKTIQEEVLQFGSFDSIQMSVDLSDTAKIMYILSEGLYKQPRHSVVCELTSNMTDSMICANKDILEKPCIVGLDDKKIWFKDFGEGVSLDRMNNIISKFGASTKDKNDKVQGVFGLGCKAPFAVSNQFTWESNYEGYKRKWLFNKEGIEFNISLFSEEETDEENGSVIIIPIKNDLHEWVEAIVSILPYFKGIVIDSAYISSLFNLSKIYEGNHFYYKKQYSPIYFHIVLDQVIYKINSNDLGLGSIDLPVGIKIGLNEGLVPTPAKDSILLTDSSKELIINRLKDVILELNDLYSVEKFDFVSYLSEITYSYKFKIGDTYINIDKSEYDKICNKLQIKRPSIDYIPVRPEFYLIPNIDKKIILKKLLISNFREIGRIGESGRYSSKYQNTSVNLTDFIIADISLNNTKIDFFKSIANSFKHDIVFVKYERKNKLFKGSFAYYNYDSLYLNNALRKDWRNIIQAWQAEEDRFINDSLKISDYKEQYEKWLINRPKTIKVNKLGVKELGDITIRLPHDFEVRNSDFNMKFEPEINPLISLNKKIYIYSNQREEVDQLYDLWKNQPNIVPCLLNKTEIHKVKDLKNFIPYQEFTKGKTRFAQKWVTAYLIQKDINNSILLREQIFVRKWGNEYKTLNQQEYSKLNIFQKSLIRNEVSDIIKYISKWTSSCTDTKFVESVLELYIKTGLIDKPVVDQWESLKIKLNDLKLLEQFPYDSKKKPFLDEYILLKKQNRQLKRQISTLKTNLQECKSK